MSKEFRMRPGGDQLRNSGFSLLEALVAILVLTIGILSLLGVYAKGVSFAHMTQWDYIAQKKAEEAVETIFTARDTKLLTWSQIQNVTGVTGNDGGVFVDGPQPLLLPGPDGLVGTQNDQASAPDTVIIGPGPDKVLGTADDDVANLSSFMTRQIQIVPVPNEPNLRQITITIVYTTESLTRTHVLISYISSFA